MVNNTDLKKQIMMLRNDKAKLKDEKERLLRERVIAKKAIIERKMLLRELADLKNPNSLAAKTLVKRTLAKAGRGTLRGGKILGKTFWLIAKDLEERRKAKAKRK